MTWPQAPDWANARVLWVDEYKNVSGSDRVGSQNTEMPSSENFPESRLWPPHPVATARGSVIVLLQLQLPLVAPYLDSLVSNSLRHAVFNYQSCQSLRQ